MGKWIVIDERVEIYLILWNLASDLKKGDYESHQRVVRSDEDLQELLNELSKNDEVVNLTIWKRQDIDYES